MNNLSESKAFNFGLWCGIMLFTVLNVLSYLDSRDGFYNSRNNLSAGSYSSGFPLIMYKAEIGNLNYSYILWSSLIGDILVTLVFSFVLGLIFKFVQSKFASRRSPLR